MGCSVPCWTRLSETEWGCWRWPHTGFDPRGARAQRLARHRAWRVTFASFPARYPLSRGRFARRRFAVLLAAEEVACSPRLPRSPPPVPAHLQVPVPTRCHPQVRSLARTDEARGLLWLLEEEALQPGGSEDTLLERLFAYYGPQEGGKKGLGVRPAPRCCAG